MKCQFRVIFLIYENRTVHWEKTTKSFWKDQMPSRHLASQIPFLGSITFGGAVVPFPVRNMPDLFAFNVTSNSIYEDSVNI